jgi:hypothetical protein
MLYILPDGMEQRLTNTALTTSPYCKCKNDYAEGEMEISG